MTTQSLEKIKDNEENPEIGNRTRLKKLGVERVYYRRPTTHAIMMARIKGDVDREKLKDALHKLQWKHLLLSSRIRVDSKQIAWFEYDTEIQPDLEVRHRTSDDDWHAVMAEEHSHYFDLEQGPLIRYVLIWSSEVSELVINCHHSICDGLSLFFLIRDIMECLAGKEPDMMIDASPVSDLVPSERRKVGLMRRVLIGLLNRVWSRQEYVFSREQFDVLHRVYWDLNKPVVHSCVLDEEDMQELVTKCHTFDVTVHTAICTALVMAQAKIQGTKESFRKSVHMPVNLRDRLVVPVGESFGFYATAVIEELEYNPSSSFWELAQRLHGRIRDCLEDDTELFRLLQMEALHPTLLDSTYFVRFGLFESRIASLVTHSMGLDGLIAGIAVTNLGNRKLQREYGTLELDAVYGPSVYTDIIEKVVSVVTLNGRMYITLTFDESRVEQRVVERVIEKFLEYLRTPA